MGAVAAGQALQKARPDLHKPAMTLAAGQGYAARIAAVRKLAGMGRRAEPALPLLIHFKAQALRLAPRAVEMDPDLRQFVSVPKRDGSLVVQAMVAAAPG